MVASNAMGSLFIMGLCGATMTLASQVCIVPTYVLTLVCSMRAFHDVLCCSASCSPPGLCGCYMRERFL